MRKISLGILALFLSVFRLSAQEDSTYKQRKLKLEEVNIVSSYYMQDGSNSAVTGGVGSEKLTDFANTFELRWMRTDKHKRQHTLSFELGIDHYTSASSDKIDPTTISSASSADTRIYPTLGWTIASEEKKTTAGLNVSYSTEYDYKSFGFGGRFSKATADGNTEVSVGIQAYLDKWTVILPLELRPPGTSEKGSVGTEPRNSYSASLSIAQVLHPRIQVALLLDGIYQKGLLATRYQRVYFEDFSEQVENLPGQRFKLPAAIRLHYFAGDRFVIRTYYRYYWDDWGLTAHTINLETAIKLNAFLSVSPFYRFYTQSMADYFAPYAAHHVSDGYYTSDYDLSGFDSHFFGSGIRWVPEKGVFGIRRWSSLELRYGHFTRTNGLHSDIITAALQFK